MGGSSGGGSSSGAVSYPEYMSVWHTTKLGNISTYMPTGINPITSPYNTAVAYDPDGEIAASAAALAVYNSLVNALDPDADWSSFWAIAQTKLETDYFSDTIIDAKVAAYSANVLARLSSNILPQYQRGMQNIRAVMTSAFTIGEAVLTADAQRDVDKYEADLKRDYEKEKSVLISHAADAMLSSLSQELSFRQNVASMTVETNRIKIVAKQEENQRNVIWSEKDALWDIELFTYAGNFLASIAGTAVSAPRTSEVSTGASMIGGALSGAAAGSAIMPGIGTGIGAVLGGLGGLL